MDISSSSTSVMASLNGLTVTEHLAEKSPMDVRTVITALPTAIAVTRPFASTLAMLASELSQMNVKSLSYTHKFPASFYSSLLDSRNITALPNRNVIKNSITDTAEA